MVFASIAIVASFDEEDGVGGGVVLLRSVLSRRRGRDRFFLGE